jgi:hypothetical protein
MIQSFSVFTKGWGKAPEFLNLVVVASPTTTHWPSTAATQTQWDSSYVASGLYIYKINFNNQLFTGRLTINH